MRRRATSTEEGQYSKNNRERGQGIAYRKSDAPAGTQNKPVGPSFAADVTGPSRWSISGHSPRAHSRRYSGCSSWSARGTLRDPRHPARARRDQQRPRNHYPGVQSSSRHERARATDATDPSQSVAPYRKRAGEDGGRGRDEVKRELRQGVSSEGAAATSLPPLGLAMHRTTARRVRAHRKQSRFQKTEIDASSRVGTANWPFSHGPRA